MTTTENKSLPRSWTLPSLLVAGGLGALTYARSRFQRQQLFLPDKYPNGVWNPGAYGLKAEDVWFQAADGVELHGWWMPRPRAQATVLYCHGNSGSIAHRVGIFRHMLRMRVNVFAFDYRGYGRSAGEPTEAGVYLDARAAYCQLVGPLEQDPKKIILFGHSLGGAVAIDAALDCPVAGLVVQSSFTHVKDMARAFFPQLPIHLLARNQFRSSEKIERLPVPKLIIHGTDDGTVPIALGRELYERAMEPKELYEVANAGHNDVHRHGGLTYLRRMARFRRRCLKLA